MDHLIFAANPIHSSQIEDLKLNKSEESIKIASTMAERKEVEKHVSDTMFILGAALDGRSTSFVTAARRCAPFRVYEMDGFSNKKTKIIKLEALMDIQRFVDSEEIEEALKLVDIAHRIGTATDLTLIEGEAKLDTQKQLMLNARKVLDQREAREAERKAKKVEAFSKSKAVKDEKDEVVPVKKIKRWRGPNFSFVDSKPSNYIRR